MYVAFLPFNASIFGVFLYAGVEFCGLLRGHVHVHEVSHDEGTCLGAAAVCVYMCVYVRA